MRYLRETTECEIRGRNLASVRGSTLTPLSSLREPNTLTYQSFMSPRYALRSGITEFENCLECTFGLDILIYSLNSLSTLNIAGLASNNLFGIPAINDYNSINKAVRIYDESYHGLISGFGRGVGLTKQKGFLQMKEEEQIDTKVGPWILTQAGLSLIELTVSGYVEIGDFRWKKLGERMGEVDFEYFWEGSVVKRIILEEDLLGQELEGIEHSLFGEEVRNEALNQFVN